MDGTSSVARRIVWAEQCCRALFEDVSIKRDEHILCFDEHAAALPRWAVFEHVVADLDIFVAYMEENRTTKELCGAPVEQAIGYGDVGVEVMDVNGSSIAVGCRILKWRGVKK